MFSFISILGLCALSCFLWNQLYSPIQILISVVKDFWDPKNNSDLKKKYGVWAVITGATDGIGKTYAKELAAKGLNIVLIARSAEKLQCCAQDIENVFHVKTKTIVVDFSTDISVYKFIEKELSDIPVGILVNNVGCHLGTLEEVTSYSDEDIWKVIRVNIGSVTYMSRMMINKMKLRGKGAIVNISSGLETRAAPYGVIYAATKAYIRSFTFSLQVELRDYNIDIQLLSPHFVSTKINSYSAAIMKGRFGIPTAEKYSRSAAYTLGRCDVTTGYVYHELQNIIFNMLPVQVQLLISGLISRILRKNQTLHRA